MTVGDAAGVLWLTANAAGAFMAGQAIGNRIRGDQPWHPHAALAEAIGASLAFLYVVAAIQFLRVTAAP